MKRKDKRISTESKSKEISEKSAAEENIKKQFGEIQTVDDLYKAPLRIQYKYHLKTATWRWGKAVDKLPWVGRKILARVQMIKCDVKSGRITKYEQERVKALYKIISSEENSQVILQMKSDFPGSWYQLSSLCSEQFYRWGETAEAKACVSEGKEILDAIVKYNAGKDSTSVLDSSDRVLKEQIRYCLAYIETHPYQNQGAKNYKSTLDYLLGCEKLVEARKRNKTNEWNGTHAHILSYLGRCYRNSMSPLANLAWGRSMSFYDKRIHFKKNAEEEHNSNPLSRRDSYKEDPVYQDLEKTFVQHRAALILILGYGFRDIQQHGRYYNGLNHNLLPARAMLSKMNDELAMNYLELLEVAAMRGLSLPAYVTRKHEVEPDYKPEDAYNKLDIVWRNFFNKLENKKLKIPALFEKALCAEYCGYWDEGERLLQKMTEFSEELKDSFWRTRALLAKALLLIKRAYHEGYENKPNRTSPENIIKREITFDTVWEIFQDPDILRDKNDFIQTKLEYNLFLGEAYLTDFKGTKKDRKQAKTAFESVLKDNRIRHSSYSDEVFNPKIEAVCRLRLAKIYIVEREFGKAKDELTIWDNFLSDKVNDIYLHYLAKQNKENLFEKNRQLVIDPVTDEEYEYPKNKKKLKKFLVRKAVQKYKDGKNKPKKINWSEVAKILDIPKSTLHRWRTDENIYPMDQEDNDTDSIKNQ